VIHHGALVPAAPGQGPRAALTGRGFEGVSVSPSRAARGAWCWPIFRPGTLQQVGGDDQEVRQVHVRVPAAETVQVRGGCCRIQAGLGDLRDPAAEPDDLVQVSRQRAVKIRGIPQWNVVLARYSPT
jgi:hypothetical protein